MSAPTNGDVAEMLDLVGNLLSVQRAPASRVQRFTAGAQAVRAHPEPVAAVVARDGREGLQRIAGVTPTVASTIEERVHTGRLALLARLQGAVSPEDLFRTLPGVGDTLARRIHGQLGIDTLEELELAAHDGRLARVDGFGERRAALVREDLEVRLLRTSRRFARLVDGRTRAERPPATEVLEIDARYRREAEGGRLPRIAPRRMNPKQEAWLPILHLDEGGYAYTALFSNTALAHKLARTHDWVVVYWERDGEDGQATVVTETRGALAGLRVIRGREQECGPPSLGPANGAPAEPEARAS